MKFGENLQKLRKEKGISQEQLAEQLGVTRQSVSKWESGNSYPEMEKIIAICNMFDCDMNVLINKDITEEREKKDASSAVKEMFQNIANYIRKTIYLFEHKSFKDIIKMIAQIIIIICVILCFAIPFMLLRDIVVSVFYTGSNWVSMFFVNLWQFIFKASYAIFAIATFLYIFKVKFLDGTEIIVEEVVENSDADVATLDTSETKEVKKTKVVRVKESSSFSLLDLLSKVITLGLKGILLFLLIPIVIGVVMMIIAFVLLIILIFQKIFLVGPILLTMGIIAFLLVIIELILNFVFNLKFSKRRIIITILSSVIVGAIGLGLSVWYFLNLNIINNVPNSFKIATEEKVYTMNDNFYIHYYDYANTKFIEDSSLTNEVRVRADYYPIVNDVTLREEDSEVYLEFGDVTGVNIKEITSSVIKDLKNQRIHVYDQLNRVKVTITTSKENIEKIKNKYQEVLYEEEVEEY